MSNILTPEEDIIDVTLQLPRALLRDFLEEQSENEEIHALPWQPFCEHLALRLVDDALRRRMAREKASGIGESF